jgi:hypothetical protein
MTWFAFTVVDRLAGEVEELDRHAPIFFADCEPDVASGLELLAKVREIRQKLHTVEQFIEREAAQRMGQKRVEWPQGFAVRHKTAKRVTWLSDDLARQVALSAMVDENGALPDEPVQQAVSAVVSAICNAASFGYWRVGQLSLLGIEADEFRHSEPGRWTVEVTARDAA